MAATPQNIAADYLSGTLAWVKKENFLVRWRYVIPLLTFIWLYSLLNQNLKAVIIVSIMGVMASYSTIYKRVIRIPSAIELVTISTVVISISYGPIAASVFAVVTTIASEVISAAVDFFTFVYAFARAITGLVSGYLYFTGIDIVALGVIMALLFNAICQPVYLLPGDVETKMKALYFFLISISFNFLAFLLLGNILLAITA